MNALGTLAAITPLLILDLLIAALLWHDNGPASATHWASISYAHEIDSDAGFFAINSSSLTITVTDVNEPPIITGPTEVSFPENGTGVVATYSAADPEGAAITLDKQRDRWGVDGDNFNSLNSSGDLTFTMPPDFEGPGDQGSDNIYNVTVVATEDERPWQSSQIQVSVTVTNVNEPPDKPEAPHVEGKEEDVHHTISVIWRKPEYNGGPRVTDYDLQYRVFTTGDDGWTDHPFTGDGTSTTIAGLLSNTKYEVQVRGGNSEGVGEWSDSGEITTLPKPLTVTFSAARYDAREGKSATVTVDLDSEADRVVSIPITAMPQGSTQQSDYTISGLSTGDALHFATGDASKSMTIAANHDLDTGDETVKIEFGTLPNKVFIGSNDHAELVIADDDGANAAPTFVDGDSASREVAENSQASTAIGDPVAATDSDNDPLTYSLTGDDASSFDIATTTGQLLVKTPLDYEARNGYSVVVQVSDLKGPTSQPDGEIDDAVEVSITVTDVDPPSEPVAPGLQPASTADGHASLKVSWEPPDDDGGGKITDYDVQYRVLTTGDGLWTDHPFTGDNTSTTITGLISNTTYEVQVRAGNAEGTGEWSDSGEGTTLPKPLTVTFSDATYDANEGSTTTVTVLLDSEADRVVNIPITATPQGHTQEADYTISGLSASSTLTFATGDSSKSITITANQDLDTDNEMVVLEFGDLPDRVSTGDNAQAVLVITDDDEPNTDPAFGDNLEFSVKENSPPGTAIGDPVAATDPDNDPLTYSLTGDDASSFDIATTTGQLIAKAPLDHEAKAEYSVVVQVSDLKGPASQPDSEIDDSVEVSILVIDVGLPGKPGSLDAHPASTADGHASLKVSWEPPEDDGGGKITDYDVQYRVLTTGDNGWTGHPFTGDGTSTTIAGLRSNATYEVQVRASNAEGAGEWSDSGEITTLPKPLAVTFSDAVYTTNEGSTTTVTVLLDSEADRKVVIPITVTPQGSTQETDYTVSGLSASSTLTFATGDSSKSITISANQDLDTDNEMVVLEFGDLPGRVSTGDNVQAVLSITDDDEANTDPAFGDNLEFSVKENSPPGTAIGDPVAATDPDNDPLTYSLTGDDASSFDIATTTGQLIAKAPLDHEAKAEYSVIVQVSDLKGPIGQPDSEIDDTVEVSITVTNVDEPPVITGPTAVSFPENGTGVVGTYSATDPEGDDITWTIGGSDHDDFNPLNSSGDLTFAQTPNFESEGDSNSDNIYNVRLIAMEDKTPGLDSHIDVSVTVTNVKEPPGKPEAPSLSGEADEGHHKVDVSWSQPPPTGGPRVTDYDLQYRVFSTGDGPWTDHPFTGDGTSTTITGLMSRTTYEVQVRASNAEGTGEWSDSGEIPTLPKPLAVTFSAATYDANEGSTTTVTVLLDSEADRVVSIPITVTPQGSTQETDYTVTGLSASSTLTFATGDSSKSITITANQDDDDADNEAVKLAFGALPSRVSSGSYTQAVLSITDDDEPNTAPIFVDGDSAIREVAENSPPGTAIGDPVTATDSDNDPLTYSMTGDDASSFDIATTTGQLITKAPLDYEARTGYSVIVQVSDLKGPIGQSDNEIDDAVEVSITVTDVGPPGKAVSLEAQPASTADGHTSMKVSWVAPADDDGPQVTDYDVQYRVLTTGDGPWTHHPFTGDSTSTIITNLLSNTTYEVQVRATSSEGTGDWSNSGNGTTLPKPLAVTFSADTYDADEGSTTTVTVLLDSEADRKVVIPITVTPQGSTQETDYTISGLSTGDTLVFATGDSSKSITITANQDLDIDNEMVVLEFGDLPDRVSSGSNVQAVLSITDDDEPNTAPIFVDGDSARREVAENSPPGTAIGDPVTATDPDGNPLTYSLTGDDASSFDIATTTGQLIAKAPLDYEGKDEYSVTVQVSDLKGPIGQPDNRIDASVEVSITVTDVEPPGKPDAPGVQPVSTADGHTRLKVSWDPPENDGGGKITDYDVQYRVLTTGDDGWTDHPFTGDGTSTTIAGLRSNTAYEVQVRASNAEGAGDWSDSGEITTLPKPLSVTFSAATYNANEGSTTTVTVLLDSEADRVVSIPITVTPQGSTEEADYTVSGLSTGDILAFVTGDSSKSITIIANQDGDTDDEMVKLAFGTLPGRVSSGDNVQAVLSITDDDEANAAPVFADGDSASREVAENSPQGTAIGIPVAATDSDNDPLTYSLTGDDADSFDIATTTGQLFAKAPLDYEGKDEYSITVRVSDLKGPIGQPDNWIDATVEVSIAVTNMNEPPVITGPTSVSFQENGMGVVGTYSATDPEGDDITWTIGGSDHDDFNPLNSTGDLTFAQTPNFESEGDSNSDNIYNVRLIAMEDKTPGLDSHIDVSVTVTNVKEPPGKPEPPTPSVEADDGHHTVYVSWNQPLSTGGPRVTSYDVQYRVFSTGDAPWTEHPFTGDGTSTTITGLMSRTTYEMQVRASNAEGAGNWSESHIFISLSKPLTVAFGEARYGADEGESATVTVDLDSDTDREVVVPITVTPLGSTQETDYTVSGLSAGGALAFSTGDSSNTITITASQDNDDADNETVKLEFGPLPDRVSLGSNEWATLVITDDDKPNADPAFSNNLEFFVTENSPRGTPIGNPVTATDPENDPLTYSLTGDHASTFDIVTTTGQLSTKAPLDYEAKTRYVINVQVSDFKNPASHPDNKIDDDVQVAIEIANVGPPGKPSSLEVQPVSTADGHAGLKVRWEAPVGDDGGKITDYDVQYRVLTTDVGPWTHHPFTGDGTSTTIADLQSITTYEVQVRATSSEGTGDWSDSGEGATLPKPLAVTFSAATYDADEGESATVMVALYPEADREVSIPITVTPQGSTQEADYAVSGFSASSTLTFATGDFSKSITITTYQDLDTDNEMVVLAFDALPDRVSSGDNSRAVLVITDDDEPNAPPVFGNNLEFAVTENSPPGTAIGGPVAATDPEDDPLHYSLTGDDADSFNIATTTGQLFAKVPLDYEAKVEYSVMVQVTDLKGPIGQPYNEIDDTVEVSIIVTDVGPPSEPVSLEAQPASTADGHASMIVSWGAPEDDGGGGITGYDVQYRVLTTGDGEDGWTGHPLTGDGISTTITGLRSNTTYEVRVRAGNVEGAGEWSQPAKFTSLTRPLVVTFSSARYYAGEGSSATVTVSLDSGADRVVSIPVAVTPQAPTREADYTVSGLSSGGILTFAAGDSSRSITITANQDRDTADETVVLEFGELPGRVSPGRNGRAVLVINDDEEPNAAPVFGRSLEFSVTENSPPGTAIGDPVTATDPEDDPLIYSLGGPHRGFFSIGATTGQLFVEALLDYEARNDYSVIVQVSDLKGPTSHPDNRTDDTVGITINVTDEDEPPGKPETPRVRPAPTDGHTRLEVSWDEPDNTGPAISDYHIQYRAGSTGDLTDTNHDSAVTTTTMTTITGLQPNTTYDVRVRAISAEGDSDWSEFGMGSTNQEPTNSGPAFADGDSTTRQAMENTPAGVAIGAPITATDPDGDPLTYILGGADVLSFDIGATTGQLIAKGPMDYEAKSGYSVIVGVRDGKGGTDTITATINIINMDEPGAVTLSTTSPQVGTELTVSLYDPDGNLSAEIWQWQRTPDGSTWIVVPDTTSAAYTPTANVAGNRLRAVVSYNDGEGAGKSAVSRATSPVSSPTPPSIDTLVETPVPTPVVSVVHPNEEMVIETDEKGATLTFPPNSRDRIFQASIDTNRSNCMVEGPPTGTLQLCVRVEIMDAEGNLEEGVRLLQSAELSIRLSPKMVETLGGPSALAETYSHGGVKLLARHSPGYPWREMPFELRVDEAGGVIVAASIREFSDFSVVTYKEVLDQVKGMVEPPKAGDAILSARLWAVLTIVGGLLLLAGSMALRAGRTGGMA